MNEGGMCLYGSYSTFPMSHLSPALSPERSRLLVVFKDAEAGLPVRHMLLPDFTVAGNSTLDEALKLANPADHDLLIVDGTLETLKALRTNAQMSTIPVMMVVSAAQAANHVAALDLGADDFVVLPIPAEVFKARVRRLISAKKRTDEQQIMITHLKTAYEKKDRFLQIVTHDLKNPVSNVRLAHYFLQTELGDKPATKEALDTIEMAVDTMTDLITHFLDTAALEKGKTQLNLEPLMMEDLIWEVVSRYSETANVKNITLLMGETEGLVLADPNRLMQVMSNLVSNAIKFSPNDRFVTISSEAYGNQVRLNVTDEGPGIPVEEQSSLFEPFAKLSPRPTNGESSSGLGLSIVKELVQLHNGTVGLDCIENGGCTFWFQLPKYEPALEAVAV